jgi:ABC-type nitrate/sulfonate/bicarbonate transport system substrate-binding protein
MQPKPNNTPAKKIPRNRLIFISIIGTVAVLLAIGAFLSRVQTGENKTAQFQFGLSAATIVDPTAPHQAEPTQPVPVITATPANAPLNLPAYEEVIDLEPIFAGKIKPKNNLPNYVCAANANGSYLLLLAMQKSGLDVKNGFNLGVIPIYLNYDYFVREAEVAKVVKRGDIDCMLTTLDSVALNDPGVVTAIIDESAGSDALLTRNIASLNNLKGKVIGYERDSASEYLVHVFLTTVQLDPNIDVELIPFEANYATMIAFENEQLDAISGQEASVRSASKAGGKLLASTKNFRFIVDVVATSQKSISAKSDLVKKFHEAWFQTLQQSSQNFDETAKQIASWGENEWTGVNANSAAEDWRKQLSTLAQADLFHNRDVMDRPAYLVDRINEARRVWQAAGKTMPETIAATLIDPQFVQSIADEWTQANKTERIKFINRSFSIAQPNVVVEEAVKEAAAARPIDVSERIETAAVTTETGDQQIAVLPCTRFEFIPNTTKLTSSSQQELNTCVLPLLQQSVGLYVRVKGSSAWPGPRGTYTQAQVRNFAVTRAKSIVDYLASRGINRNRFLTEGVLPPKDHWETNDTAKQNEDRYVEMTLLVSGR